MAAVVHNHIESGLSPPYDGSEMEDLFPDLAGVEQHNDEQYNKENDIIEVPPGNSEQNLLNYFMKTVDPSSGCQEDDMLPDNTSDNNDIEGEINDSGWKELRVRARQNSDENSRMSSPVEENELGLNRNALMARLNRQKKKKYLQELETSIKSLKEENITLKQDNKTMAATVEKLETEVCYLKGVIANQSELSSLLQNIGVTGLRLHSSFPHKTPLKQSNSKNLSMKRHYESESDQELLQSETESESEILQNEPRIRGKYCPPASDHDYTLNVSSPEQIKGVKNVAMQHLSQNELKSPPAKVRKANNSRASMPPMTCYAKTVATRSGQNVPQTVVSVGGQCEVEKLKSVGTNQGKRPRTRRATRAAEATAGVCLHVSSGSVSLEFCAHCSNRAQAAVTAEEEIIEVVA
ncbi:uncharacterized protein [Amphiura filiformis]|uniref:uncharacterized protein n=1 Tax=Amphiura filiformis TaxID=82378 RepID=UPI003B21D56B